MPRRKKTPESLEKPSRSAEMPSSKVSQKSLEGKGEHESIQRKVSQRILERKMSKENSENLSRKTFQENSMKPSVKRSKKQVGIPSITIPPKTSKGTGKKKASISLKMPRQKCSTKPSKKASCKSLDTNAKIVAPTLRKNSETITESAVKGQSSATCVICKRSFTSENLLNDHNIKHHFIRYCPNCPKTFRHTRKFILHLRTHLNDFPYQCKICLESFNEKNLFLEHKGIHVNFRWLRCPLCSEVFYHANAFMEHKQTHQGPPYPCSLCKAVFSNPRDRNVHSRNHVNRCILCPKEVVAFPTNLDLLFHINFAHQETLTNDDTAQTFEDCVSVGNVNLDENGDSDSMDDLYSSDDESLADIDDNYQKDAVEPVYTLKRKDKFICFICYDLYPSSELLQSHMKAHNWFPCNFCPEFFVDPEAFHNHKCHCAYVPRADANCSTENECGNCGKTVANDVASYTFEHCISTGSVNFEESNDRESRNDLFSSDTESLADLYYNYQKMLLPKSYFADVNCSSEIECGKCKKTPSKMTIDISGVNMNATQSIVSKFQDMRYDIVQLINFIEYVKCKKLPLDVATLNRIGLHSTSLRIILTDNKIRCCFPSEYITEIEDMYFKLQDYNQNICDVINYSLEQ